MLKKNSKKIWIGICLIVCSLCGCGNAENAESAIDGNLISVHKDGSVTSTMKENFIEDYYVQEELQTQILNEIMKYNQSIGTDSIGVEKVTVDNESVHVIMNYALPSDYAEYNQVTFFVGTISEAYEAGYDLNVKLKDVTDETQILGKDELLEKGLFHIIITNEPVQVVPISAEEAGFQSIQIETYNTILYVSEGVKLDNKKKNATINEEVKGMTYIVFK